MSFMQFTWGTCAGLIMLSNKIDGAGKGDVSVVSLTAISALSSRKPSHRYSFNFKNNLFLIIKKTLLGIYPEKLTRL